MGHFIRFIHNRDLAAENILTAYVRQRLILASPPGVVTRLFKRLQDNGFRLPERTMLTLANEVSTTINISYAGYKHTFTIHVTDITYDCIPL